MRPKDKLKTALERVLKAQTPRQRRKWQRRVVEMRQEIKQHEKNVLHRRKQRRQSRIDVLNHACEYGWRKPTPQQAEFMQDYIHYKINKPLSRPDVLRRFIDRRRVVAKKLKHAKGEAKVMFLIELQYLKKRIVQTLTSNETDFSLDSFLKDGDTLFV